MVRLARYNGRRASGLAEVYHFATLVVRLVRPIPRVAARVTGSSKSPGPSTRPCDLSWVAATALVSATSASQPNQLSRLPPPGLRVSASWECSVCLVDSHTQAAASSKPARPTAPAIATLDHWNPVGSPATNQARAKRRFA